MQLLGIFNWNTILSKAKGFLPLPFDWICFLTLASLPKVANNESHNRISKIYDRGNENAGL